MQMPLSHHCQKKDGHEGKHIMYGYDIHTNMLNCHLGIGHVRVKIKLHAKIHFHILLKLEM
jgi:hypothetical protein